jgi:hypothetical protein
VLRLLLLQVALLVAQNGVVFTDLLVAETGVVEFDVGGRWDFVEVAVGVQQVGCDFAGGAFAAQDALADAGRSQFADVSSRVVGRVGLLVVGFVDSYNFLLVVFEEVSAGGALGGEFGFAGSIESGLDIDDEVGDLWGDCFEDLVGVDDSVLKVVLVGVLHDDDGAAGLDLVEVEETSVFVGQLNVLVE